MIRCMQGKKPVWQDYSRKTGCFRDTREEADGLVIASPVYYASANATLIACLDRLFYSTHFDKTMKVGAGIACARRGGCSATFDELNKYFTISGMPVASSQYWNSIHGRTQGEADQDEEGKQTMRTLAAQALNCEPCRIAKTLSFLVGEEPILIVMAGDVRINNAKYKAQFGKKAKMLTKEEVVSLIGYAVGGVCPFAVNEGVTTCLDESPKRFSTVFPACGSSNSAIELNMEELEKYSLCEGWVAVTKLMEQA